MGSLHGSPNGSAHNTRTIRAQGSLSYLLATLLWGLNIPLTAVLLQTWDPYLLSVLRVALASITFVAIAAMAHATIPIAKIVKPLRLLSTSGFLPRSFCSTTWACTLATRLPPRP